METQSCDCLLCSYPVFYSQSCMSLSSEANLEVKKNNAGAIVSWEAGQETVQALI